MKKIVYNQRGNNDKVFLLTEREFAEAFPMLNDRNNYWCQRLEVLLSPYFKWVETPPDELENEIFYLISPNGNTEKIYKKDNKFFQKMETHSEDNVKKLIVLSDKQKKKLISQEDFYQNLKKIE